MPVRWSRYDPSYLEPEAKKESYQRPLEELTEEEREQMELKAVRPIKAAPPTLSSSTLENIKRKQLEKYHKAPENEKETIECNPYVIFHQAVKNCQPIIGLSNITRGGKTYQVPVPLTDNRKRFLAMKWLITECRENKHRRTMMPEKLSQELLLAFNNEGPVIKRKHVLHKMAEANRAYAHFRWCPELDDLQQQELGQGAKPLLQKETISEEREELVHPLGIHLFQLLTNAVQLQDQAVHLQKEEQMAEHKAMEAPLHPPGCAVYRSLAGQQAHQQLFPALTSSSFCRLSGCASRNRQS
ncbi:28S ribosomal protein S7 [Lamprotornis superbus]|uniref:28S ribosomal protein S7 n=1 Tax=Lamprotornis superbus TaxID=245042 RepID=A0A835NH79_9PASS|nr:28S ribosomal protein S7 [Lamprotornis superbus]